MERIAVIGDVHAEAGRLDAALNWVHGQRVDAILCTGDVADGPGSVDTCCALLEEAGALTVRGNHDRWLLQDRVREIEGAHRRHELGAAALAYLEGLPRTRRFETQRGALLLCHGIGDNDLRKVWPGSPRMAPERSGELDALIEAREFRFVINGHMHYRVLVDFPELTLLNAGTLASRHRPGISILDLAGAEVSAYEFVEDRVGPRVAAFPLEPEGRRVWRDTQEFDGDWTPATLYGKDPA